MIIVSLHSAATVAVLHASWFLFFICVVVTATTTLDIPCNWTGGVYLVDLASPQPAGCNISGTAVLDCRYWVSNCSDASFALRISVINSSSVSPWSLGKLFVSIENVVNVWVDIDGVTQGSEINVIVRNVSNDALFLPTCNKTNNASKCVDWPAVAAPAVVSISNSTFVTSATILLDGASSTTSGPLVASGGFLLISNVSLPSRSVVQVLNSKAISLTAVTNNNLPLVLPFIALRTTRFGDGSSITLDQLNMTSSVGRGVIEFDAVQMNSDGTVGIHKSVVTTTGSILHPYPLLFQGSTFASSTYIFVENTTVSSLKGSPQLQYGLMVLSTTLSGSSGMMIEDTRWLLLIPSISGVQGGAAIGILTSTVIDNSFVSVSRCIVNSSQQFLMRLGSSSIARGSSVTLSSASFLSSSSAFLLSVQTGTSITFGSQVTLTDSVSLGNVSFLATVGQSVTFSYGSEMIMSNCSTQQTQQRSVFISWTEVSHGSRMTFTMCTFRGAFGIQLQTISVLNGSVIYVLQTNIVSASVAAVSLEASSVITDHSRIQISGCTFVATQTNAQSGLKLVGSNTIHNVSSVTVMDSFICVRYGYTFDIASLRVSRGSNVTFLVRDNNDSSTSGQLSPSGTLLRMSDIVATDHCLISLVLSSSSSNNNPTTTAGGTWTVASSWADNGIALTGLSLSNASTLMLRNVSLVLADITRDANTTTSYAAILIMDVTLLTGSSIALMGEGYGNVQSATTSMSSMLVWAFRAIHVGSVLLQNGSSIFVAGWQVTVADLSFTQSRASPSAIQVQDVVLQGGSFLTVSTMTTVPPNTSSVVTTFMHTFLLLLNISSSTNSVVTVKDCVLSLAPSSKTLIYSGIKINAPFVMDGDGAVFSLTNVTFSSTRGHGVLYVNGTTLQGGALLNITSITSNAPDLPIVTIARCIATTASHVIVQKLLNTDVATAPFSVQLVQSSWDGNSTFFAQNLDRLQSSLFAADTCRVTNGSRFTISKSKLNSQFGILLQSLYVALSSTVEIVDCTIQAFQTGVYLNDTAFLNGSVLAISRNALYPFASASMNSPKGIQFDALRLDASSVTMTQNYIRATPILNVNGVPATMVGIANSFLKNRSTVSFSILTSPRPDIIPQLFDLYNTVMDRMSRVSIPGSGWSWVTNIGVPFVRVRNCVLVGAANIVLQDWVVNATTSAAVVSTISGAPPPSWMCQTTNAFLTLENVSLSTSSSVVLSRTYPGGVQWCGNSLLRLMNVVADESSLVLVNQNWNVTDGCVAVTNCSSLSRVVDGFAVVNASNVTVSGVGGAIQFVSVVVDADMSRGGGFLYATGLTLTGRDSNVLITSGSMLRMLAEPNLTSSSSLSSSSSASLLAVKSVMLIRDSIFSSGGFFRIEYSDITTLGFRHGLVLFNVTMLASSLIAVVEVSLSINVTVAAAFAAESVLVNLDVSSSSSGGVGLLRSAVVAMVLVKESTLTGPTTAITLTTVSDRRVPGPASSMLMMPTAALWLDGNVTVSSGAEMYVRDANFSWGGVFVAPDPTTVRPTSVVVFRELSHLKMVNITVSGYVLFVVVAPPPPMIGPRGTTSATAGGFQVSNATVVISNTRIVIGVSSASPAAAAAVVARSNRTGGFILDGATFRNSSILLVQDIGATSDSLDRNLTVPFLSVRNSFIGYSSGVYFKSINCPTMARTSDTSSLRTECISWSNATITNYSFVEVLTVWVPLCNGGGGIMSLRNSAIAANSTVMFLNMTGVSTLSSSASSCDTSIRDNRGAMITFDRVMVTSRSLLAATGLTLSLKSGGGAAVVVRNCRIRNSTFEVTGHNVEFSFAVFSTLPMSALAMVGFANVIAAAVVMMDTVFEDGSHVTSFANSTAALINTAPSGMTLLNAVGLVAVNVSVTGNSRWWSVGNDGEGGERSPSSPSRIQGAALCLAWTTGTVSVGSSVRLFSGDGTRCSSIGGGARLVSLDITGSSAVTVLDGSNVHITSTLSKFLAEWNYVMFSVSDSSILSASRLALFTRSSSVPLNDATSVLAVTSSMIDGVITLSTGVQIINTLFAGGSGFFIVFEENYPNASSAVSQLLLSGVLSCGEFQCVYLSNVTVASNSVLMLNFESVALLSVTGAARSISGTVQSLDFMLVDALHVMTSSNVSISISAVTTSGTVNPIAHRFDVDNRTRPLRFSSLLILRTSDVNSGCGIRWFGVAAPNNSDASSFSPLPILPLDGTSTFFILQDVTLTGAATLLLIKNVRIEINIPLHVVLPLSSSAGFMSWTGATAMVEQASCIIETIHIASNTSDFVVPRDTVPSMWSLSAILFAAPYTGTSQGAGPLLRDASLFVTNVTVSPLVSFDSVIALFRDVQDAATISLRGVDAVTRCSSIMFERVTWSSSSSSPPPVQASKLVIDIQDNTLTVPFPVDGIGYVLSTPCDGAVIAVSQSNLVGATIGISNSVFWCSRGWKGSCIGLCASNLTRFDLSADNSTLNCPTVTAPMSSSSSSNSIGSKLYPLFAIHVDNAMIVSESMTLSLERCIVLGGRGNVVLQPLLVSGTTLEVVLKDSTLVAVGDDAYSPPWSNIELSQLGEVDPTNGPLSSSTTFVRLLVVSSSLLVEFEGSSSGGTAATSGPQEEKRLSFQSIFNYKHTLPYGTLQIALINAQILRSSLVVLHCLNNVLNISIDRSLIATGPISLFSAAATPSSYPSQILVETVASCLALINATSTSSQVSLRVAQTTCSVETIYRSSAGAEGVALGSLVDGVMLSALRYDNLDAWYSPVGSSADYRPPQISIDNCTFVGFTRVLFLVPPLAEPHLALQTFLRRRPVVSIYCNGWIGYNVHSRVNGNVTKPLVHFLGGAGRSDAVDAVNANLIDQSCARTHCWVSVTAIKQILWAAPMLLNFSLVNRALTCPAVSLRRADSASNTITSTLSSDTTLSASMNETITVAWSSSATRSLSFPSSSKTPPLLPPVYTMLHAIARQIVVLSSLATVVSGAALAVVSPSTAAFIHVSSQAVTLMASARRCEQQTSEQAYDDSTPPFSSDAFSNPLQVSLAAANTKLAWAAGTPLGNIALLFVVAVLHGGWLACKQRNPAEEGRGNEEAKHIKKDEQDDVPFLRTVFQSIRDSPLPGTLLLPYTTLLQPSLTAATAVVAAACGGADLTFAPLTYTTGWICFGCGSIAVWMSPIAWAAYALYYPSFPLVSSAVVSQHNTSRGGVSRSSLLSMPGWWSSFRAKYATPSYEWVPIKQEDESVDREEVLDVTRRSKFIIFHLMMPLEPYNRGHHWFVMVELGVAILCAGVSGVGAISDNCVTATVCVYLLGAITLCFLITCILRQPYATRIDWAVSVVNSAVTLVVILLLLLDASSAADGLLIMQTVLSCVVLLIWIGLRKPSAPSKLLSRAFRNEDVAVAASEVLADNIDKDRRRVTLRTIRPMHQRTMTSAALTADETNDDVARDGGVLFFVPTREERNRQLARLITLACNRRGQEALVADSDDDVGEISQDDL